MAVNSIYLRPSADISVEHSLSSGTSGYLLIDESSCDGSSTYLGSKAADANTTSTLTSSFELSGGIPSGKINVRDAKIVVGHISNQYTNGSITFVVNLNGESFTSDSVSITGSAILASTEIKESTSFNNDNIFVNAINDYIDLNGVFPSDITISFTTSVTGESKGAADLKISQVYIELTYDICTYRKINDAWHLSIVGYQKINGAWKSIGNPSSILKSEGASMGHHHIAIPAIASTCTETGLTKGYECSMCGEIILPQTVTAAKGHTSSVVAAVEPTCGTIGLKEGSKCSVCGVILVEQEVIPATGEHEEYISSGGKQICPVCGYVDGMGMCELVYHGTATDLSVARCYLGAAHVGDYALFGGGDIYIKGSSATVDAYNTSLTRSTPTELSAARENIKTTTVGNYALFGGGANSGNSTMYTTVDAYNTSLTRSTPTGLSAARYEHAATTIGNYALFGGGYSMSGSTQTTHASVDAYDTSLTRSIPAALSVARHRIAATTVGDYALFSGGDGNDTSDNSDLVLDVYNSSLTLQTITETTINPTESSVATTVGNYALFDTAHSGSMGQIVAYDSSLTRSEPTRLSNNSSDSAVTLGGYALFYTSPSFGSSDYDAIVETYNTFLTHSISTELSINRDALASTIVGNYALFGGGDNGSTNDYSTVDVYRIQPISQ